MKKFTGCGTALVTPFLDDDEQSVDEAALRVMVDRQIKAGVDFLVPCGTTGESPTLEHPEHYRVIDIVIEQTAGRVPIMAGTGSNSEREAVSLTRHAMKAGAAACLVVTGYYNKPPQRGIIKLMRAVADVGLPTYVYNIPGRAVVNILPESMAELARHPNIAGIKEATGNLEQMTQDIILCEDQVSYLSGDDTITLPLMSVGGHGVISVVSNIIPGRIAALTQAAAAGNWDEARNIHLACFPLAKAMFCETNPIPIKWALAALGLCQPVWRSPMVPPTAAQEEIIRIEMKKAGLNPVL